MQAKQDRVQASLPRVDQGSTQEEGMMDFMTRTEWELRKALAQTKRMRPPQPKTIEAIGNKIRGAENRLVDYRKRLQNIALNSWSHAFYLAASCILSQEVFQHLENQEEPLVF